MGVAHPFELSGTSSSLSFSFYPFHFSQLDSSYAIHPDLAPFEYTFCSIQFAMLFSYFYL
jgi:hypothetical protein